MRDTRNDVGEANPGFIEDVKGTCGLSRMTKLCIVTDTSPKLCLKRNIRAKIARRKKAFMKKAITLYDELIDSFQYTAKSWLHVDLAAKTIRDAHVIAAASAFLFDNMFAKENSGQDITVATATNLAKDFSGSELSSVATRMRLAMSGNDFEQGKSPLRDYIKWVSEAEPVVLEGYKDNMGKLVLITIEEMVNLVMAEIDIHEAPMHVAELYFLNISDLYANTFLNLLGKNNFQTYPSSSYLVSVQESMETIRSQILD